MHTMYRYIYIEREIEIDAVWVTIINTCHKFAIFPDSIYLDLLFYGFQPWDLSLAIATFYLPWAHFQTDEQIPGKSFQSQISLKHPVATSTSVFLIYI